MAINVLLFGRLTHELGIYQDTIEHTEQLTPELVFNQLVTKHNPQTLKNNIGVAINEEYSAWDTMLRDGDELAFIPPVAGG